MIVSAAMIVYNAEKYIKEALQSVLAQTYQVDELIICDDASTDMTVIVAEDYLRSAKWGVVWKIIRNKENIGNKRNAIKCYSECCSGDVVIVVDADDISRPNRFAKLVEQFNNPDVCMAFSDADVFFGDDYTRTIPLWECLGFDYEDVCNQTSYERRIIRRFTVSGCTMAFRKELALKCRTVGEKCAWDMWYAWMAPFYGEVVAIPEQLVMYRQHSNNDSKTVKQKNNTTKITRIQKIRKCFHNPINQWFFDSIFFGERLLEIKRFLPDTNDRFKEKMVNAMGFFEAVFSLQTMKRFDRVSLLRKYWQNGMYQQYRGNKNQMLLDSVNVLLH